MRFLPGKYNTSDWLTRQYEENKTLNNNYKSNPNDDYTVDQNKYISQVLSLLVNVDNWSDIDVTEPIHTEEPPPPMGGRPRPGGDQICHLSKLTTGKKTFLAEIQQVRKVGTVLTVDEMFSMVHGGVNFHRGVFQTWKDLNEQFPGHKIPHRVIEEKVRSCSTCQKARDNMRYVIPEEKLNLKPSHYR
jgi:hypothetical protein